MLSWLLVIILAYFFFSIASLGDKLVLNRSQSPRLYAFYVGFLSLLVLLVIPFVGISLPNLATLAWVAATSLILMAGLYVLYTAVQKHDVSRIVPMVGAFQPIVIFFMSWIFFRHETFQFNTIVAFLILLLASIVISFEKKPELTKSIVFFSITASFLIALSFIFIKIVFLQINFWQGVIWIGVFNFFWVLAFLFGKSFRKELFYQGSALDKKTIGLVIATQSAGGLAGLLQNLAIYLAPVHALALMNALRGIQYVFLFIITLIFSVFSPTILKEDFSKRVVFQKTIAITLIIVGLVILAL